MDISRMQQRVGFGGVGAAGGMVIGAQLGAKTDRGVAGVVVGGALGAAAGFGAGFGIGLFGTMPNPDGNQYNDQHDHGDMNNLASMIAAGSTAALGTGVAFFALGAKPSAGHVGLTAFAILGAAMVAASIGGVTNPVPDTPPAPERPPVTQPQPLPKH